MNRVKLYRSLTFLLLFQVVFIKIIARFPDLVERYYSNGIYPIISRFFRIVFGWIPFSIGDVYYILLGAFLIYSLYNFFKEGIRKNIQEKLWRLGAFVSVFYFLFHFLWALNYYRNPLFTSLNLERKDYTKEQLVALSEDLLDKIKKVHYQITKNDTVKVIIEDDKTVIMDNAVGAYENLSKVMLEFTYKSPSIKKSLFSVPLTYAGFSGYLNPFSGEAQVDYLVPKHSLPSLTTHEIAHQIGYASESEANFIGFLAATKHSDPYYQYSGYLKALRYSLGATYGKDSIAGKRLLNAIPIGIKKNIEETQEFWKSYQNKAEPFFKFFYDNYLKANQQKDGIKGYSNMVGLLVAYREKYEL